MLEETKDAGVKDENVNSTAKRTEGFEEGEIGQREKNDSIVGYRGVKLFL